MDFLVPAYTVARDEQLSSSEASISDQGDGDGNYDVSDDDDDGGGDESLTHEDTAAAGDRITKTSYRTTVFFSLFL